MMPDQRKIVSDTCKAEAHALRGALAPLQTVARLLGTPASDLTEELKRTAQTRLQQLAELADWLDEVAGQLATAALVLPDAGGADDVETATTAPIAEIQEKTVSTKPTALVLDDDDGIRCVWPMEGRRLGLSSVTTFASMEECEAASPDYAQFDFAFVDKNIPDSAWRLDQVIAHLKACGVKRVLVASGESARALANDPLCAAADGVIPMKIPQKLPE